MCKYCSFDTLFSFRFVTFYSILFRYWAFFSVVSFIWRDIFEMVANNEQTSIEQTHSAKLMIEKENKR